MSGSEELLAAINASASKHTDHVQSNQTRESLAEHMYEISGDPSGSPIELYYSLEDTETLKTFLDIAEAVKFNNSDTIKMEKPLLPLNAWSSSNRTVKHGLTKAFLYKESSDAHRGYVIGRLGSKIIQNVAICDDGLLRSERGRELPKSQAMGWGKLPDHELLEANLSRFSAGLVVPLRTQSLLALPEILAFQIPSKSLGDIDPSQFTETQEPRR